MPGSKPSISSGTSGGLLVRVPGFVSKHPFFGPAAPLPFLPADLFNLSFLRRYPSRLQFFNFVKQQPPGIKRLSPC